uniref:Uncharacterized protein n=1 Tax=Monopterus albus TaxID=43700 RepID=A0A3Q3Q569_MONAL
MNGKRTPSGCLWRRILPEHTEDLNTTQGHHQHLLCYDFTLFSTKHCGLTVLSTSSQQVDNVFVFSNHLHHLHL